MQFVCLYACIMSVIATEKVSTSRWAWIVLIAVCCGRLLVSTSMYMSGVFYVALLRHFRGSETKTSVIGSLHSGLLCLLGPIVAILIDSTSCRTSIVCGSIILSLTFLVSSFIDDINYLILTLGICGGAANSMISTPFSIVLGYYFEKRRNLVIALSISVVGLGMFIATPLSVYLLQNYGLKGTFIIVGAFNAHICICGVICRPSNEEIAIQKQKRNIPGRDSNGEIQQRSVKVTDKISNCFKRINTNLLRNVPFMLFLLSTATWNFTESVCLLHLPNYMSSKGHSEGSISILMIIYGVSNTVGRFLSALTTETAAGFDTLKVHIVTLALAGVVTLTFRLYSDFDNAVNVYAACSAIFTGFPNSVMSSITIRLVGLKDFSTGHGLELFFCGIGILTGPPLAGYIFEMTKSYENSFLLSGSVIMAGSFLAILSSVLAPGKVTGGVETNPGPGMKMGSIIDICSVVSPSDERCPDSLPDQQERKNDKMESVL